ncbi:MAG: ABC transporter permease [Candidatus Marinimicrobia bacterium]|nr:ABC transporter permease [Candidatus Neomarinimicrobiota bacterium]MCH7954974.1 ABC transporter permease [Candidatus Neomarinimicrobiota bacterium]
MSVELFIASRHLLAHKKVGFISFISILSIIGIAIGVASLILTLSVVNGFETEIVQRIIGFDSHIRIRQYHFQPMQDYDEVERKIERIDGVRVAYPYILREAVIRSKTNLDGIIVEGVIGEDETFRKQVGENFDGAYFTSPQTKEGLPAIVLGSKLAARLSVEKGDSLTLMVFKGIPGPFNTPYLKRFRLSGTFETGMVEYDDVFAYIPLSSAQRLFNMPSSVTGMKIFIDEFEEANIVSNEIEEMLGGYPYYPLTWKERHRNLFKWLDTQRFPMVLVFGLIAIVAIFNITSTLVMIVMDKKRDIGLLKALGFRTRQILKIFLMEGTLIGITGTLFGVLTAYGLGTLQQTMKLITIPPDVYFMDSLPVSMQPEYFIVIGGVAILLCILATLYPSLKASRLTPASALREE